MKLIWKEYLAIFLALVADGVDYTIAAIPYVGEVVDTPFDIVVPIANAILLKNPIPLIALSENASVLVPLDLLDYLPLHIALVAWYLYRKKEKKN